MAGVLADGAVGVPAPALRALVSRYVGYHYRGFPPGVHLGLPSPELTVVISLARPTRVAWDHDGTPTGHDALASGLHSRPAFIHHDGEQYGIQLALTPHGARVLFGVPAAALARTVTDLDAVAGPATAGLGGRLATLDGWAARFTVLDEVLTALAGHTSARHRGTQVRGPLAHVWARLLGSGGRLRVGDLAAELGWSRRHLSGRFAAEFGVTPKEAARIARFDRSRRLLLAATPAAVPAGAAAGAAAGPGTGPAAGPGTTLEAGPGAGPRVVAHAAAGRTRRSGLATRPAPLDRVGTLAGVAAACGYHDQPHLVRDWRDLAGMAPSAWLAAEDLPTSARLPPG